MEQANRKCAHLERIMLVCGTQNAGKSRLLRHMLTDERLGAELPASPRIRVRALSRERGLAVRFTSPHETGETQAEFHRKLDRVMQIAWRTFWRVNYACAIQPRPFKDMPGIVDVCHGLWNSFNPERIRVVQLAPDQWGDDSNKLAPAEIDGLRAADVEVISIDARRNPKNAAEPGNIRILAGYFDFS